MRPFRKLITLQEALEIGYGAIKRMERSEIIPVPQAAGRVVAGDVEAEMDVPPFPRASMDGYALRSEDTLGAKRMDPVTLDIRGSVYAGEIDGVRVQGGECVGIATGAVLPAGADAVVMVENTEREGDRVQVMKPVYPGENVSGRGEDMMKGDRLVRDGDVLNPGRIGALCAVGMKTVRVYARPVVAIVPTGLEIAEPGEELRPGQVYNVNAYTLAPLVESNGGIARVMPIIDDTLEALEGVLGEVSGSDMVVFTGGSSVGSRDLIVDLFKRRGEVLFHGVMVKPGKPTIMGMINGMVLLGMPGYPTSCLSNGYLILEPLLRKMARLPKSRRETSEAVVSQRIVSTIGRHQFYPVRVEGEVAHLTFKESGAITSMSEANGFVEIPTDVDLIEKGEIVTVTFF